ncbi:MAG: hypothetical protein R8K53_08835 [Mariprofundaceae bacterium]
MQATRNAPLHHICQKLVQGDAMYIAAGVIELDTTTILAAYHEVDFFTDAYVETVMEATANMLRGPLVEEVDELISAQKNQPFTRHLQEVYFRTPHTHHFICTVPETSSALILVAAVQAERNIVWQVANTTLASIAPHCPPPIRF